MMLPILISVSVAPVSYFFCASAPLLIAASKAMAAEKAPNRNWIAGMWVSLISVERVLFSDWKRFLAPARIQYLLPVAIKKKPPATKSKGALFSRTWLGTLQALVAEFAADDVAEQLPFLALEPHHLKLLDRGEVGR